MTSAASRRTILDLSDHLPPNSREPPAQPRWVFEALAFVEPTFVYISGLQRWNSDGGRCDLASISQAKA